MSVVEIIKHYQRSLGKCGDDINRTLHCVGKLFNLPITVQHLQETGIGRTVNALRKHEGQCGEAAKACVAKWKAMVAAEESSDPEEPAPAPESDEVYSPPEMAEDKASKKRSREVIQHIEKSSRREESTNRTRDKALDEYDRVKRHKDKQTSSISSSDERPDLEETRARVNGGSSRESSSYSVSPKVAKSRHDSSERARYQNESSERSKSRNESSERTKTQNESSERTKSRNESSERAKTQNETSERSKSRNESSKRSKTQSESSERSKIRNESSERSKTQSESSERSKSRNESSEQVKSRTESSEKSKSRNEFSGRSKSRNESSERSKSRDSSSHSKDCHEEKKKEKRHEEHAALKERSRAQPSGSAKDKTTKQGQKQEENATEVRNGNRHREKERRRGPDKKPVTADDGSIDFLSGASFEEALGIMAPARHSSPSSRQSPSKPSKPVTPSKLGKSSTSTSRLADYDLLSTSEHLEPLPAELASSIESLPTINPNYRPLPNAYNPYDSPPSKKVKSASNEEALARLMYHKAERTRVYSGVKGAGRRGEPASLFDSCVRVLQDNIEALGYTGGVPYSILKPVLEKATAVQLFDLEDFNPYLVEDTDELWEFHVKKQFRTLVREEMESYRELYMRGLDERAAKLEVLKSNIKQSQATSVPVRQAKMTYMDSAAKPPREVARQQARNGTARPQPRGVSSPSSSRVATIVSAKPKPRVAPLMQKAMKFAKTFKR